MRKNPHDKILRDELKKQYLNTIPKSRPKTETIASTRVHKSLKSKLIIIYKTNPYLNSK